jgi:hypothetical protein
MKTLDEIHGRCVPDSITGCKVWRGHCDKYGPRIYAPDLSDGGAMKVQYGRRAVYQLATGQALASGWRVFGTCGNAACLEFGHMQACTPAERGLEVAEIGSQKGKMTRIVANRLIGQRRSKLTPDLIAEISASTETGLALAARLGLGRTTISKVRKGQALSFMPVGGLFSGLMR